MESDQEASDNDGVKGRDEEATPHLVSRAGARGDEEATAHLVSRAGAGRDEEATAHLVTWYLELELGLMKNKQLVLCNTSAPV